MSRRSRHNKIGKRYHKPGTAPGTLLPPEGPTGLPARITLIEYGPDHLEERQIERVEDLQAYCDTPEVTWVNVDGLHVPTIEKLGKIFNFHPLALEDVVNCGQRPKIDDYGTYHFMVLKSVRMKDGALETEQISFFLSGNFVITLQEIPGDSFEAVRDRIRRGKGNIRKAGPDYLVYALIDALVDEFFPVLEAYGEQIEDLEDEVVQRPTPEVLREVHRIKRELLTLRRSAWPERELISVMQREDLHLIQPGTRVFLRDCYDHTIQVIDMIETYRDLASGLLDAYLSSASNRLNEVMKVLTVISTIFIPLNFIAGVYGMNFRSDADHPLNMPELHWYWGYPYALGMMLLVALGLVMYFRKKGWF